jgi:hypothetical protein
MHYETRRQSRIQDKIGISYYYILLEGVAKGFTKRPETVPMGLDTTSS